MAENISNPLNIEKILTNENKRNSIHIDMDKYNTYSNDKFDEMKKSNFGFNDQLDIAKFSSTNHQDDNEIKERKIFVDQLFDESINIDFNKKEENNLSNNLIKDNENNNRVHLFTESVHDFSARDSDLFKYEKIINNNLPIHKNSNSLSKINHQINYINNQDNYIAKDYDKDNFENLHQEFRNGNNDNIVPAYGNVINSNENNYDKNYLISRLFSDNIHTEPDQQHFNVCARPNDTKEKIETKLFSNPNIADINKNSDRNFNAYNYKNPFDDSEYNENNINIEPNNQSINIVDKLNVSSLNKKNSINNNSKNENSNSIDRVSLDNPNFVFNNITDRNVKEKDEPKYSDRFSSTNIISRLNQPFQSINVGDFEEENQNKDKNENINLNNFSSFNINNVNKNDLIKDKDEFFKEEKEEIIIKNTNISNKGSDKFINQNLQEYINIENQIQLVSNLEEKVRTIKDEEPQKLANNIQNSRIPLPHSDNFLSSNVSVKKSTKDVNEFILLSGDDSRSDNNLNNSKIKKSYTLNKNNDPNLLEEIDLEFDNDKINEDNNFNFNLCLTNNSIKNFNDLEVKNQIGHNLSSYIKTNDIKINENDFSSKGCKNTNFDFHQANNQQKKSDNIIFDNSTFDFDINSRKEQILVKANNPKLEIKVNNNTDNKNHLKENIFNTNARENIDNQQVKIQANFDMFKDFDKNKIVNSNLEFDFTANKTDKSLMNLNEIQRSNLKKENFENKNDNKNVYNFEIKNNPNNPYTKNIITRNSLKSEEKNPNGQFEEEGIQDQLLNGDNNFNVNSNRFDNIHFKDSECDKEKSAEELMHKNQNINFDKIIFDVLDKNEKKKNVNFNQEFHESNSNDNHIPADYINLDDFQSGKMNEYNNKAVNKNHKDFIDINYKVDQIQMQIQDEVPVIEDSDSLYVQSRLDDYKQGSGIFNSYSEKLEKPFVNKVSNLNNKKIDYLKRKTKINEDNFFSEEKSFAKIKHDNNFQLRRNFSYDPAVLVSEIEAIFLNLFENYDFDKLKKKLKNPTKEVKTKSESNISYLQSWQTFKSNANLMNFNQSKLKLIENQTKFIREIKSDGNGFYRAFMFAIMESYIFNENILGIRNLLIEINEIIDVPLTNNIDIPKQEILSIFNIILEHLELKDIETAYSIFINAYGVKTESPMLSETPYTTSFDNCMIKYMRLSIKKYIIRNEDELLKTNKFPHISQTFPEEYNTGNGKIDLLTYYKDRLLNFEFEADMNVICLASIVFEMGLDMYIIEGIHKDDFSQINTFTQHIPSFSRNGENQIFMENLKLLYRSGKYSVIYTNQEVSKIESKKKKFDLMKFMNNEKYNEKIIVIMSDYGCEICHNVSQLIQIKKFNDTSFCENCMKTFLIKVMDKRVIGLIQENFLNFEYYSRPIAIDEKGNFQVNDDEFMFLFNTTITKMIVGKLNSLCSVCQSPKDANQLFKLNCSCCFCDKCFSNFIDKATDGKIVMNLYEKRNLVSRGSINLLCPCGVAFETELAINMKYKKLDNWIQKANERLISTCKSTCIYCLQDLGSLKNKQKLPGNKQLYYILKLQPESSKKIQISNDDHIICKDCCSGTLKNHFDNLIRKKIIKAKDKSYPIECAICQVTHQVESTNLTKVLKSESGCCQIL